TENCTYAYDEFGRVGQTVFHHDTTNTNTDVVTSFYDRDGRLARQHTADGPDIAGQSTVYSAINYVYNRKTGQLVQTFTDNAIATAATVGSTTITDVRYVYDVLGRLTNVVG